MSTSTSFYIDEIARALCNSLEADDYDELTEESVVKALYRQQALTALARAGQTRLLSGHKELLAHYEQVLTEMRDRDDINGSLPEWYRDRIDSALMPATKAKCPRCDDVGWIIDYDTGVERVTQCHHPL